MALRDVIPEGPIRRRFGGDTDTSDVTLSDLEDEFGPEVVRRGIAYMESLHDADENFRERIRHKNYVREGLRNVGQSPEDVEVTEQASKANDKWQKNSEQKGLGLDDEQ